MLPGVESTWKSVDVDMFNLTVLQNSLKNTERVLKTVIKNVNLISLLKTLGTEESPLNFVVGVVALQVCHNLVFILEFSRLLVFRERYVNVDVKFLQTVNKKVYQIFL